MKHLMKGIACVVLSLAVCLVVAGCMNSNRGEQDANVTPMVSATPFPTGTAPGMGMPLATPNVTTQPYDWTGNAAAVEDKIGRISEIGNARVLVNGTTALVGVTFDEAYKGEMTQRIHDMIASEVQAVDPQVKVVAVTAEQEDVAKITELADKVQSGTPIAELEQEIDTIVRNATTMQ